MENTERSGVPSGWVRITVIHEDGRVKSGIVTPQYAEQALLTLDENWVPPEIREENV